MRVTSSSRGQAKLPDPEAVPFITLYPPVHQQRYGNGVPLGLASPALASRQPDVEEAPPAASISASASVAVAESGTRSVSALQIKNVVGDWSWRQVFCLRREL